MKARTETNSTAIFNNNSYSNFTPTSTALKSAIKGDGKIHENEINRHFGKRNHIIPPRKISPTRYKYKIIPEEIPIKKDLKPLDFHTNELLEETPQIFKSLSHPANGGSNTFIYLPDPCQTFVIDDEIIRKNTLNQMKAANGASETVNDGDAAEYLSYVIEKNHSDPKMKEEDSAKQEEEENVISESETKSEPVTNFKVNEIAKPYEISANNSDVNTNCCKKHSLEYSEICDKNVQCNGEKPAGDTPVLSFDKRKEQAFSRLQDELQKAHQELKLKDEEVSRLTRIREDVERELEELTASLFQEAHKMVREANEKQAAAEKSVTESQMKVEVLTAEVAALKTLVLTSTPSRPNPHLHPQLGKDEAAGGVNLFNRKHRRSPSHFNLKYGRENSPPESPVRDQQNPVQDSLSVDVREPMEVDPTVHKEFLNWKQAAKLDKTDPFIDRIYREDINLCLDFHNKELAEEVRKAIESRNIFVEAVTDKTKTMFPRKCALLEVSRQCHYRMKLGDQDAWYSISQMCRNRIIAVCDFFNYLRYIELGLVKSTAHDIYWEITRLRKEMVLARLGLSISTV